MARTSAVLIGLALGISGAVVIAALSDHQYNAGFDAGVKQERALKAEHDKFMRDLGTCDWAKIMSKNIKCQRQLP